MTKDLVLVLLEKDKYYLSDIRLYSNVQVATNNNLVWVKGIISDQENDTQIKKIPFKNIYTIDKDSNLFNLGSLTPIDKLKVLDWITIDKFINLEFPSSLMAGRVKETHHVKLIKSDKVQTGNAMITDFEIWNNYAQNASEIRLNKLIFAVSKSNQVIIIGQPLPPIQGLEYWLNNDLLIPAGYDFEIPILANLIFEKLNIKNSSYILFDTNNQWQKIFKENFVNASRSAIRLTSQSVSK